MKEGNDLTLRAHYRKISSVKSYVTSKRKDQQAHPQSGYSFHHAQDYLSIYRICHALRGAILHCVNSEGHMQSDQYLLISHIFQSKNTGMLIFFLFL